MKIKILGTCVCGCEEKNYLTFESKIIKISWFKDCGDWFIYLHVGKSYVRFSSAGFIKGKSK